MLLAPSREVTAQTEKNNHCVFWGRCFRGFHAVQSHTSLLSALLEFHAPTLVTGPGNDQLALAKMVREHTSRSREGGICPRG